MDTIIVIESKESDRLRLEAILEDDYAIITDDNLDNIDNYITQVSQFKIV